MGVATAMAIAGRSRVGWLMPAGAARRLVAAASYGVQIVGSLLFILAAGQSPLLLLLGIVLFGAGIGNATSLPPLIAQAEFAREDVARVIALIVATAQAAYAFAPAIFGALRTVPLAPAAAPGEAPIFFFAAALVQAIAIGCLLAGRRRRFSPAIMSP